MRVGLKQTQICCRFRSPLLKDEIHLEGRSTRIREDQMSSLLSGRTTLRSVELEKKMTMKTMPHLMRGWTNPASNRTTVMVKATKSSRIASQCYIQAHVEAARLKRRIGRLPRNSSCQAAMCRKVWNKVRTIRAF